MATYEMRERGSPRGHACGALATSNQDDIQLQRLGKRPSLKRNFGMLSLVGFSCIILLTWEGIIVAFDQVIHNGGPAGVLYAYFFAWTGTACCFLVLGELASMAPTAGGQYHWCAMLAPMNCMKFLSYVTGWLTSIGWLAANAATNHLCAILIQNLIKFNHPSYSPGAWKRILICWCVQLLSLGANVVGRKFLPRIETLALLIHILGFFGIMITLAYMSEHKSSKEVFHKFWNTGNFDTESLSWFVGMIGCAAAFSGADGGVHMAEEVENAAIALPQALLLTLMINGLLGIGILVVLLYCIDNLESAMNATGYSPVQFFFLATGSTPGTISMTCLCVVMNVVACFGVLAPTSRQIWSLARDRGIPGWTIWRRVSSRRLPTYAIYLAVMVSLLISLIDIGSEIAHTVIISIAIPGWYSSYLIVEVLLLYRRCKGQVFRHADNDDAKINAPGEQLVWGQFRVPGIWGTLVNGYAVVYTAIVIFFSFWPSEMNPTAIEMNYSVVSTGGTIIFAVVYYVSSARYFYRGPVIETNM